MHRTATAIGTRLALGHGVSKDIALLRPQLATLDIALGPAAAMLAMLQRLGKELSILAAGAAPIRFTKGRMTAPIEQTLLGPADPTRRDIASPRSTFSRFARTFLPPIQDSAPVTREAGTLTSPSARQENGQAPLGASIPSARSDAPHKTETTLTRTAPRIAQPVHGTEPMATTLARGSDMPSPVWTAGSEDPISYAPAPGDTPSGASADEDIGTLSLQRPEQTLSLPFSIMQAAPRFDQPQQTQIAGPISAGAVAIADFSAAPLNLSGPRNGRSPEASQLPEASRSLKASRSPEASRSPAETLVSDPWAAMPTRGLSSPLAVTRSPVADEPGEQQSTAELPQSAVALDGVQLGRWIVEYLERQASRPGTMITGIDPRMTATFPGAPSGV